MAVSEQPTRRLDERATRIARARQERGTEHLRAVFGLVIEHDEEGNALPPPFNVVSALIGAGRFGDPSGHEKPVRMKAGCPVVRDAEHRRKHRLRKISRTSRKRNRP